MSEAEARALFLLAGIEASKFHKLANKYWPEHEHYAQIRADSPWWLVQTPHGLVQIGWRKRVISINWEDTEARIVITADDVTKDETMVHAWSRVKALEYLTALARHLATPYDDIPIDYARAFAASGASQSQQPAPAEPDLAGALITPLPYSKGDADAKFLSADYRRGWNDCCQQALTCAQAMLAAAAVQPPVVPHDELSLDPDGDVSLDWSSHEGLLSISISSTGKACFACRTGDSSAHGTFTLPALAYTVLRALVEAKVRGIGSVPPSDPGEAK